MSTMSDLDLQLQAIRDVIGEPTESERAQIFIERTVESIINDLDALCCYAVDPATSPFVEAEKIAIGQIVTRAQLIASFLMARQPNTFKRTVGHG